MTKATRSPRAPSFDLEDCLKKALGLYEDNRKHAIPVDVAAKKMGYSGSNNGSAARSFASMKAFGLIEANNKGDVTVSPDIEAYKYSPDDQHRQDLLIKWLRMPKVFAELLDTYEDRLPSDDVVRYQLIRKGFLPTSAEECLKTFKTSANYAGYYSIERSQRTSSDDESIPEVMGAASDVNAVSLPSAKSTPQPSAHVTGLHTVANALDRIPVRLSGGRKAWIEIPTPFYEADKEQLKNQIDLIFADEEIFSDPQ